MRMEGVDPRHAPRMWPVGAMPPVLPMIGLPGPTLSDFSRTVVLTTLSVLPGQAIDGSPGKSGAVAFAPVVVAAQLFLGENLLAWLVLALGGALAVGTALALVRPPVESAEGNLARPPLARSVVMIAVGAVAALWALASLVAG
jgi:hypothetical protein